MNDGFEPLIEKLPSGGKPAPIRWFVNYKNLIGILGCFLLFCLGVAVNGSLGLYFNLSAILVVTGGTFGATLISFRFKRLGIVWKVLVSSYRTNVKSPNEIVGILVDLSVKSRLQGLLSLQSDEEETTVMFLRQALGFLVDGYSEREIRDSLSAEMFFFRQRREESERVFTTMADICPSFGLIGSVVGLVSMLAGVGDTTIILSTIPMALVSTLYGVFFANFLFLPFAANIRERTDQELLLQKIIMEGVIAIKSESHTMKLERKLKSFLTPSAREGKLVSLKRIREILEKNSLVMKNDLRPRTDDTSSDENPKQNGSVGPSSPQGEFRTSA
jgi:chemotaxis protein MotA